MFALGSFARGAFLGIPAKKAPECWLLKPSLHTSVMLSLHTSVSILSNLHLMVVGTAFLLTTGDEPKRRW